MGWSATDLTRKLLAERRHVWFAESMKRVRKTVEALTGLTGCIAEAGACVSG